MTDQTIYWDLKFFDRLTCTELYNILALRQEVFIIEQDCIYPDIDNMDQKSLHLSGYVNETLIAYLRVVPPGVKFEEPSIGRIVVRRSWRGNLIGEKLVNRGLKKALHLYPGMDTRIEAQVYLEKFYQKLGFKTTTAPYDLDGIPHVQMLFSQPQP